MTELQTTVEFSVELYKFYNVDLFQRGYYQIRSSLRMSPRYSSKIEVCLPNNRADNSGGSEDDSQTAPSSQIAFPSCIVNGSAVSKTFQILYRNEEVPLEDVALFKVHLIVDSKKIEDSLLKADFQLTVELWFTEHTFGPDQHNSIQCVSSRSMKLHLCPLKGLHHHLPVLFDYFHLSAVTLTVHGCLLAIHQPYVTVSKPGKPTWLANSPKVGNRFQSSTSLESVLFGNVVMKPSPSLSRLNQARCIHHNICTLLLSSYESLQNKLIEYMKLLPPWQQLKIEVTDCYAKLRKLKELAKNHQWLCYKSHRQSRESRLKLRSGGRVVDAEDELLAIVNSDIAQLCAENIILWQQFLESFTLKDRIQQHLTREHHLQRVKRFAEGFFVVENTRQSIFHCAEQSYQLYLSISDSIRKTKYFSSLPSLAIECSEMDGNAETLPVIFEDHYQDLSKNRSGTKKAPSAISVHDIGFDVSLKDEMVAALLKKPAGSDTEVWRLDRKRTKPPNAQVKEPKTVGCFSTGITPKSSMSSEDLYYVGSRVGGNHTRKRKVASLPRGCASVEEAVTNDNDNVDAISTGRTCVGPKTSASAEQIARLREELNRCGLDARYFCATSSAAIPKFIKAKRQEAFRVSGSKSLSAAEEESVKLTPRGNCQARSIPRLETVPLFPRSSERGVRSTRAIVTSASMDLGTSSRFHLNGTLVGSRQSTQRCNYDWRADSFPSSADHHKITKDTKPSAETGPRVGGSTDVPSRASSGIQTSRNAVNDTSLSSTVSNKGIPNNGISIPTAEYKLYGSQAAKVSNDCAKVNLISSSIADPTRRPQRNSPNEAELDEVNCLQHKLKDSLKLELKPENDISHHSTVPCTSRRVSAKARRRFGGLQLMQSLKNHSPTCSTSSDSVVLTGYKKLEQSESLPVGLGLVGQRASGNASGRRYNSKGCCRDRHIVEEMEDTEDELFAEQNFGVKRLRKRKVTRSMPNVFTLPKEKNLDVSLVTSESMPDLGSEATEVDDPASVSLQNVQNHHHRLDGARWSSSDSTRMAPKATVENSDTEENVADMLTAESSAVGRIVTRTKKNSGKEPGTNEEKARLFQKKKKKKKKKVLNMTREIEVKKMNKGRVLNRHHKRSSSCSSSSSTSERSGWVSSQYSSQGTSSSDGTRDSSPPPPPSSDKKAASLVPIHVQDNGVQSSAEDEHHIYEEIHLPPEEFRDPSPPTKSAPNTKPTTGSSSLAESDKGRQRTRSSNRAYEAVNCKPRKETITAEMTSSSDVAGVRHRSRQRPQLTRSRAVRNQHHNHNYRPEREHVNKVSRRDPVTAKYLDTKCTILEMFTDTAFCGYESNVKNGPRSPEFSLGLSKDGLDSDADNVPAAPPPPRNQTPSYPKINDVGNSTSTTTTTTEEESRQEDSTSAASTLVSLVGHNTVNFVKAKEEFKKQLSLPAFLYSDCPLLASNIPYFHVSEDYRLACNEGLHLVICVHGLDGNSADLRLVKTYLELGLPCSNLEFLMSERNQGDTFSDFNKMTDKLVAEILYHIEVYRLSPARISFIGHSLGNIIIRSALARPQMKPLLGRLHTFLSLSGPHLGTLYNSSGLVNVGLWFMQKWKKSGSLLQLSMKDAADIRRTFLYRLSQKPGLEYFRNILLFGSSQDRYVPIHSARIEHCKASLKDASVQGMAYRDMVHGLLQPVARNPNITFVRYDVHHALPNTANTLIGRAAHIAVLDSELFLEKFLTVCGLKYFK